MIATECAVSDCAAEEDGPDTGDDAADGEDEDVETRDYEWCARCHDEGLDWWLNLRGGWGDDGCKDARHKCCFLRGESGVDFSAGAVCACKADGWNKDILKIRAGDVSGEEMKRQLLTYVPILALIRSALICPTKEYSCAKDGAGPACLFGHEINEVGSSRRRRDALSTADTVAPIYDNPT